MKDAPQHNANKVQIPAHPGWYFINYLQTAECHPQGSDNEVSVTECTWVTTPVLYWLKDREIAKFYPVGINPVQPIHKSALLVTPEYLLVDFDSGQVMGSIENFTNLISEKHPDRSGLNRTLTMIKRNRHK